MKKRIGLCLMCLMLVFLAVACGKSTGTVEDQIPDSYAAAVIVTINPQVKLFLDADHVVIGVEYLNEDARTAFGTLDFSGMTIDECMGGIVDAAVAHKFLTDGKKISIEVAEVKDPTCDSSAICSEMAVSAEAAVTSCGVEANVSAQVPVEIPASEEEVTIPEEESAVAEEESTAPEEEPTAEEEEPAVAEEESAAPEEEQAEPEEASGVSVQNACPTCGGTGKCDECMGDGYRGSGYTVSCPRCHGSLTETCIYCDENGNSTKHEGTCDFPNCMGAHVYACTICGGGTTPVTCASCDGSGNCKTCGGSGTQ